MIKASFEKQNGFFTKIEVSGHSGYAESGKDIVCSAVSSVLWCTTNSLTSLLNIPLDIKENDGLVSYIIPQTEPDTAEKANLFIEGMLRFFKELQKQYGDYIQILEV